MLRSLPGCGTVNGVVPRDSDAFRQLLRQHRVSAGLTQEALAERAGLSMRGIQNLERGERRPYPDTTARLIEALALQGPARAEFEDAARRLPRERTRAPAPHNLPAALTECIGRDVRAGCARRRPRACATGHAGRSGRGRQDPTRAPLRPAAGRGGSHRERRRVAGRAGRRGRPAPGAAGGVRRVRRARGGGSSAAGDADRRAPATRAADRARQLRARAHRQRAAGRVAAQRLSAGARAGHQSPAAGAGRRGRSGDAAAGGAAGARHARHHRGRVDRRRARLRVGAAVRRTRAGGAARVRARRAQRRATSRASAVSSTACRWRSSWPRPACGRCRRASSPTISSDRSSC